MAEVIEPYNLEAENCRRLGARRGLGFHIWGGKVNNDYEARDATEEEQALWDCLLPAGYDGRELVATIEEIRTSLRYRRGPFTMSPKDFAVIVKEGTSEFFEPCTMRELMLAGLYGWYLNPGVEDSGLREVSVYVSRSIPVGFFYEGERVAEIHSTKASRKAVRRVIFPLADSVVQRVRDGLRPFMV